MDTFLSELGSDAGFRGLDPSEVSMLPWPSRCVRQGESNSSLAMPRSVAECVNVSCCDQNSACMQIRLVFHPRRGTDWRANPRNRVAQKLLKQLSPEFARATEGQHAAGLSAREGTDIFSEIAFLDGASYILAYTSLHVVCLVMLECSQTASRSRTQTRFLLVVDQA